MPDSSLNSPQQLIRYLEASGESDNIDAKRPIVWDSGPNSASLAKDIVAFANSRDGGVLVVGKTETDPSQFELTGLTDDQADSFETTKVAAWINSRFSPPVRLICHRLAHDGKTFVIVSVSEFDDVPILCVKSYADPTHPKKLLLRENTIYVRNSSAESAPLGSVEELRNLIGLATAKRGDQMLAMFSSMLKGRPIAPSPTDEERFEKEFAEVEPALSSVSARGSTPGAWRLVFHPDSYIEDRWPERDDLEALIRKRAVRIRDEFPPSYRGTHPREWGICNDYYGEPWAFTRSGLFVCRKPFLENLATYKSPWMTYDEPPEPEMGPGEWLDFELSVYTIIEFFMFMARMAEEYEPGERLTCRLAAEPLDGRKLVSQNPRVHVSHGPPEECRAEKYHWSRSIPAEEFRAEWERLCAAAMKEFFHLFPGPRASEETLLKWIESFKNRNFS